MRSLKTLASYLELSCEIDQPIRHLEMDSRLVARGDFFVALEGARRDGHDFLEEVRLKGAIAALVKKGKRIPKNFPCLVVEDTLKGLQKLAQKVVENEKHPIVGITGSLGKTTTKEFLGQLIKNHLSALVSPGNQNSQAGLPNTILNFDPKVLWYVLEMGMTDPGHIENLIKIAPPQIAVVTSISWQHASLFKEGLLGIAKEKASIFLHPKTKYGLFFLDAPHSDVLKTTGTCPKKSFSLKDASADYFLDTQNQKIWCQNRAYHFEWPQIPVHHQVNFLAAVAAGHLMGVSLEELCASCIELKLPPMRFQQLEIHGIHVINDAYNANPEAYCAAFQSLPHPSGDGRRIGVISEMDALGAYTEKGHSLVAQKSLDVFDLLFCIGERSQLIYDYWKKHNKPVFFAHVVEELLPQIADTVKSSDVLFLKGARGHSLERVVEYLRKIRACD